MSFQDALEHFLVERWRAALGLERIGAQDDFFDLGGDEAAAVRLVDALEGELHARLHPAAVHDAPTVRRFAAYLRDHYPDAVAQWPADGASAPRPVSRPTRSVDANRLALFRERITRSALGAAPLVAKQESGLPGMVFILCSPRSGSTLLRVMLGGHPLLFAPPELNLLSFATMGQRRAACAGRNNFMLEGAVRAVMAIRHCDRVEAEAALHDVEKQDVTTESLIRRLRREVAPAGLVDKSTAYALDPAVMARAESMYPDARYIHLVRHPQACARSAEEIRLDRLLFRGRHPFAPREFGELLWTACHRHVLQFLAEVPPARQLRMSFERLVEAPRATMESVCDFLGLSFADEMLEPYRGGTRKMIDGLYATRRMQGDPKFHEYQAIDPSVATAWERDGSSHPLGAVTRETAETLGYRWEDPSEHVSRGLPRRFAARGASARAAVPDCVHRRFEDRVERTPEAIALEAAGATLTYRELNRAANRLAHDLQSLGIDRGAPVGVLMSRSPASVIGLLAILKAGGTYLPLDPAFPPARLAELLTENAMWGVLTETALRSSLSAFYGRILCLDEAGPEHRKQSDENPTATVALDDDAYIIFTSGSTGKSKGVCVTHRVATAHLEVMREAFGLTPTDRVLHFASSSVDVSLEQILSTLYAGATLVLRGDEPWSATDVVRKAAELRLSVMNLPTSYWHQLCLELAGDAAFRCERPGRLRLVVVGGEAMRREAVSQWQRTPFAGVSLLNAYGPTEAVITASLYEVPPGDGESETANEVPIGYPLGDRTLHVLDPEGRPVREGEVGELHIGGALLARGYWRRPDLTAKRFVPDPFTKSRGARLYRTGDLVRRGRERALEFVGRVDEQVKLRGFRIEPAEIECELRNDPIVHDCVVVPRPGPAGDLRLVAYVVLAGAQLPGLRSGFDRTALRARLQERLPPYMLPTAFVGVPELPLTAAGKVDRKGLPEPDWQLAAPGGKGARARTPLELEIASCWQQVLGRRRIGKRDNFFDLGGHSLHLVRVHGELQRSLDREIPITELFRFPTVEALAKRLEGRFSDPSPDAPFRARAQRKRARLPARKQRNRAGHEQRPDH